MACRVIKDDLVEIGDPSALYSDLVQIAEGESGPMYAGKQVSTNRTVCFAWFCFNVYWGIYSLENMGFSNVPGEVRCRTIILAGISQGLFCLRNIGH